MIDLNGFKVNYRDKTYQAVCAEPVFTNYETMNSDGIYHPSILRVWVLNERGYLTDISGNYYKFNFIKDGKDHD